MNNPVMRQNIFLLLYSILLFTPEVFAGTLKGKVTDEKGEALPFATVFIQGTTIGTTSNAEGLYALSLPSGNHKVTCRYLSGK
jgi:hypothetical protein